MRALTKVDVILHKVGVNTRCFKYWNTPRVEVVSRQIEHEATVERYRRMCRDYCEDGTVWDFSGEYDEYISQGMTPYDAWHEVMVEFAWK